MGKDWLKTIVIILLFGVFSIVKTAGSNLQDIHDNWNLYKCNPAIMPFAGSLAPPGTNVSTSDNFSYCTQSMMANFAPSITQPFSYLQDMTTQMMGSINDSMAASTSQSASMTDSITNIFSSIYGVFLNVIIEFTVIINKIMDTQAKMSGIISTILFIMTTTQYLFLSMWNGIPGAMIRLFGKL